MHSNYNDWITDAINKHVNGQRQTPPPPRFDTEQRQEDTVAVLEKALQEMGTPE